MDEYMIYNTETEQSEGYEILDAGMAEARNRDARELGEPVRWILCEDDLEQISPQEEL